MRRRSVFDALLIPIVDKVLIVLAVYQGVDNSPHSFVLDLREVPLIRIGAILGPGFRIVPPLLPGYRRLGGSFFIQVSGLHPLFKLIDRHLDNVTSAAPPLCII